MKDLDRSQLENVTGGMIPHGAGMAGGMGGMSGSMGKVTKDLAKNSVSKIAKDYAKRNRGKISKDSCTGQARDRRSGGGGRSRVICTHFFRKGMIEQKVWRADLEFTQQHLSETTVRGYHFWAIPYVELMRKNTFFEKVMFPIAKYRAIELAHKMGVVEKGSFRGKLIRFVIEPACFVIGTFCKQKDWERLWSTNN
ncbi:hypothetical protein QTG64_002908 [Vibrio vulnificus]|nr:hypothetical protein [Vibrio vulnificus]ELQ2465189.1 hypothetical protein [Vibrio vulnificus]